MYVTETLIVGINGLIQKVLKGFGAIIVLMIAMPAHADTNKLITYQGRLLRPDGTAVHGNIRFAIKILSPAPQSCELWVETQTTSVVKGVFDLQIGNTANRNLTGGGVATNFNQVFVNNAAITHTGATCATGNSYMPAQGDDRTLQVSFTDLEQTIRIVDMPIKSVPFAMQAEQIAGYSVNYLFKVAGTGQLGHKATRLYSEDASNLLWELANNQDLQMQRLRNAADPIDLQDVATKAYVDAVATGGTVASANIAVNSPLLIASSGTTQTISLGTTGIAAATVGSATSVPQISFDAWGRITMATEVAIEISAAQITSGTLGVSRGGTGISNFSPYALLGANMTGDALIQHTCTNSGEVLTWTNGAGWACQPVTFSGTLGVNAGGTGLVPTIADANKLYVVDSSGTMATFKSLVAGTGLVLTDSGGTLSLSAGSTGVGQWQDVAAGIHYSAGSVGIGTATPTARLDVTGTSDQVQLAVRANGTQTYNVFEVRDSSNSVISGMTAMGRVFANPGSAAFPGFNFTGVGDANGMFKPTTDTVAFATAGVERLRVTPSGSVGIGVTSPSARLEVGGNITASGSDVSTNLMVLNANSSTGRFPTIQAVNFLGATTAGGPQFQGVNYRGDASASAAAQMNDRLVSLQGLGGTGPGWASSVGGKVDIVASENFSGAGNGARIEFHTTLNASTGPVERMRISNDGRVGIGTTAPSGILHLNGTLASNSALVLPAAGTAVRPVGLAGMIRYNTDENKYEVYETAGWASLSTSTGTSGASQWGNNSRGIHFANGSVGIGNNNPQSELHLTGGMIIEGGAGLVGLRGGDPMTATAAPYLAPAVATGFSPTPVYSFWYQSGLGLSNPADQTIAIATSNVERMRVTSTGLVGIGANNPQAKLHVEGVDNTPYSLSSGAIMPGGNGESRIIIGNDEQTDGTGSYLVFSPSNNAAAYNPAYIGAIASSADGNDTAPEVVFGSFANVQYKEHMRIDSFGRIGMGTTAPSGILHLNGTLASNSALVLPAAGTAVRPVGLAGMIRYNTDLAKYEVYETAGWASLSTSTGTAGASQWSNVTNGINYANTGSVGIGVANPAFKLDVLGTINSSSTISGFRFAAVSEGPFSPLSSFNALGGTDEKHWDFAQTANRFEIRALDDAYLENRQAISFIRSGYQITNVNFPYGNVAIGTTGAGNKLTIAAESGTPPLQIIRSSNAGQSANISLMPQGVLSASNVNWQVGMNYGSNDFNIRTWDSTEAFERISIKNSGNIGIGTTAPSGILHLAGTLATNSALVLPAAGTAVRPTGLAGMIRYNTDLAKYEVYETAGWASIATSVGTSGASQWSNISNGISYATGSVAIGKSSAAFALDVNGGISSNGLYTFNYNATPYVATGVRSGYPSAIFQNQATADGTPSYISISTHNTANTTQSAVVGSVSTNSGLPHIIFAQANDDTNITERMRIDGDGFVGIGTTSPIQGLHVHDSNALISRNSSGAGDGAQLEVASFGSANATLRLSHAQGSMSAPMASENGRRLATVEMSGYGAAFGRGNAYISAFATENFTGGSPGGGGTELRFGTTENQNGNETDRLYIKHDGRVGIGVESPSGILHLNGTLASNSALVLPAAGNAVRPTGIVGMIRYNTDLAKYEVYETAGWASVSTGSGTAGASQWANNSRGINYNSGSIGVGTNNPIGILDVYANVGGDFDSYFRNKNVGEAAVNIYLGNDQGDKVGALSLGSDQHSYAVYKNRLALETSALADGITVLADGPTGDIRFHTASVNNERMRIANSGNIGIGTTNPQSKLHVDGLTGGADLRVQAYDPSISLYAVKPDGIENARLDMYRSWGSFEALDNDIRMGEIRSFGSDGTDYEEGAGLRFVVDGTVSNDNMPSAISFMARDNGSDYPIERMRLNHQGFLGIGYGLTAPSGLLHLQGGEAIIGPWLAGTGNTGRIQFRELAANGVNAIGFRAPDSIASDVLLTLPATAGTMGQVLTTDGTGVLSWTSSAGGGDFLSNGSVAMSGPIRAANGAVGAPSYSFSSDTNLGMYRVSSNILGFATSGVERARLSATGLTVGLDITARDLNAEDLNLSGGIQISTGGSYGKMVRSDNDLILVFDSNDNTSSEYFAIRGGTNDLLRMTKAGNLGIGTTAPSGILHLRGTLATNSALVLPAAGSSVRPSGIAGMIRYNTDDQKYEVYETTGWASLSTSTGTSGSSYWTAATGGINFGGGNIGIGTNNPVGYADAGPIVHLKSSGTNSPEINLDATTGGGREWVLVSDVDGRFYVHDKAGGVDAISIEGIATTVPRLFAQHGIMNSNTPGANLLIDSTYDSTKGNIAVAPWGGNVGIGTETPAVKLEVAGNVNVGSQTSRTTASDRGQLALGSTYLQTVNANHTVDWDRGNIQEVATFVCNGSRTFTMNNMKDGASYSLFVSGAGSHSGLCNFVGTGLTFKTGGGAIAPTAGFDVIFHFTRINNTVIYTMVDALQ